MGSDWPFIQSDRHIEHIYKGNNSPRRVESYPGCGHRGGPFIRTDQPTQKCIFTVFTIGIGRVAIIEVGGCSYRSSTRCEYIHIYSRDKALRKGLNPSRGMSCSRGREEK